jgi:hypothetical protein
MIESTELAPPAPENFTSSPAVDESMTGTNGRLSAFSGMFLSFCMVVNFNY